MPRRLGFAPPFADDLDSRGASLARTSLGSRGRVGNLGRVLPPGRLFCFLACLPTIPVKAKGCPLILCLPSGAGTPLVCSVEL